jgi:hypothetical protein
MFYHTNTISHNILLSQMREPYALHTVTHFGNRINKEKYNQSLCQHNSEVASIMNLKILCHSFGLNMDNRFHYFLFG